MPCSETSTPVSFEITNHPTYIEVYLSGAPDVEELAQSAILEALTYPSPHRLLDFRSADVRHLGVREIRRICDIRSTAPVDRLTRTAFLVSTAAQFGMAREFEALNGHPLLKVGIFRVREEALAWVCAEDPAAR